MPLINEDAFTLNTLTKAINAVPRHPTVIGDLQLFHEYGIATKNLVLEWRDGRIDLLPDTPRGAPGVPHVSTKRQQLKVPTAHFRTLDRIYADEVQDVRAEFGGTEMQTLDDVRDRKLGEMRRNLEQTIEHQRIGALKGLVQDKDGNTIVDLFAAFGVGQQSVDLDLDASAPASHVGNKMVSAVRLCEDVTGVPAKSYVVLAGATMMDKIRAHPSLVGAVSGWNASAIQIADHRFGDIVIGGCVFREYRQPSGGPTYLAADEGYLVPLGVPDLLLTRYAPADYKETVNTLGIPFYAKGQAGPMDRYVDIEAQSNPISIVTKPRAIIKLTVT